MKRFYQSAKAVETALGWHVALDGRPLKTQAGKPQVVPSEALARMLAAEWAAQGETIEPSGFLLRDMVDYALDAVAADRDAVIDKLLGYGETDTLCYRADPDEALYRRQVEVWEPLLAQCEAREGVALTRVSGVIHRAQPPATLATLRRRLETLDAFTLAALDQLASLAASLTVGLAALELDADGTALWNAANLEEDWQIEQWGADEEAAVRRAKREREFLAAMEFAAAVR